MSERSIHGSRPVALVTGGARRIGAAIVRRLHAEGLDIALHFHASSADATALAGELEGRRQGSTLLLQADLAEFDRLPELIAHAIGRFGRLDALVNNASAFFPTAFGQSTPAQWDALFAANARAPFFLSQAAAPHLRATRGAIVNLADIHGERPLREHAIYGMSKAALLQMTRALALELAPDVRVNAVAPGPILWPDEEVFDELARQRIISHTPLRREGSPDDVAKAVHYLLADASYVTGETINVDGGRHVAL